MRASAKAVLRCTAVVAASTVLVSAVPLCAQPHRIASPAGRSATEIRGSYRPPGNLGGPGVYVGGRWIEVAYGRPIKRGRDLFGPPDFVEALNDGAEVWRAGANYSTRLITEARLKIGGADVAPGEYTLFIVLGREEWTLIVSTWPAQTTYDYDNKEALFGAYDYTADRDVVRVPMELETLPDSFEQLSWQFLDMSAHGGRLAILWDRKMASVPFSIDDAPEPAHRLRPASPAGASAAEVRGHYDEREGYVDGRWIEILYGRPIRRGRRIFGSPDFAIKLNDGAPVWRAGANVSTRLITELPLSFGETEVPAGEYTVFIELRHDRWTFIVSRWPAQRVYDQHDRNALFGSFHYRPDKDVLRAEMLVETLPYSFDQLSWQFLDMSDNGGRLAILWDDRMASIPFRIVD